MLRSLWLVIKHDTAVLMGQWSFWVFSFLMPAILLGYMTYSSLSDGGQANAGPPTAAPPAESPASMPAVGLVDAAGLITRTPPGWPPDWPTRYPDEAAARAALAAGTIEQYVLLPADYLTTGQVAVYDQDFQILSSGEALGVGYGSAQAWLLAYLLDYNLTGDAQLISLLRNPTPGALTAQHRVRPPTAALDAAASPLVDWVASIVPFIFYFLLVLSGSYLMRSVVAEKESRTAEVLLLSLAPRDLMFGKILAISLVLAVQLVIWVTALILGNSADLLPLAGFVLPAGFWVWAAVFLVLGYLLFASVMAAVGALAPNAREGGQTIWLLILPLMPTMMFGSDMIAQPDSRLTLFLSLFPFSAPSAMVTRLAVGPVPGWQIAASLAGLTLTTALLINWAGRFFRADHLLSFESFNWRRLLTDWRAPPAGGAAPTR